MTRSPANHLERLYGWLPLLVLPEGAFVLVLGDWPRWTLMWLLSLAIYIGCKWLTWHSAEVDHVPLWKQAAYLLAWPGLDAATFMNPARIPQAARPRARDWLFAAAKLAIGLMLVAGVMWWMPAATRHLSCAGPDGSACRAYAACGRFAPAISSGSICPFARL